MTDMVDQEENLTGNTEVTLGNTEATAPGIKATKPGILCAVTKRETKPGTPRETTLNIDPSCTPINMNIFSPVIYVRSPK